MIPFQISVSKGWLHDFGGFSFTESYYDDPYHRAKTDAEIDRYIQESFTDMPVYNFESNLVQQEFIHPGIIRVGALQPNLILGRLLGAEYVFPEGADADIDRSPLKGIASKEELPEPDGLLAHPAIRHFDRQIRSVMQDSGKICIPPFFWDTSGRATIHGILTTAHKLVGEDFFILMYEDVDLAHAILTWITESYLLLIEHYARLGRIDITSAHIGECSGCLVSLPGFSEFAQPYIERISERWPVRVHSCGRSDHLLESLTSIRNLYSLDVGSDTSVASIRARLGSRFLIEVAPPVEILLEGSDEEAAARWAETTIIENQGGPLEVKIHLEPGYSLKNVQIVYQRFLDTGQ